MKYLNLALAFFAFALTGSINAAPITSLQITGGNFSMAGVGGVIHPGAYANMTVGGYDGSAPISGCPCTAEALLTSVAVAEFGFFGNIAVYTAPTDGINSGFAPLSGDWTGSNLTLNLAAWTGYWNGSSFNQGSSHVVTTTDAMGNFTASWSAVVVGTPYNGQIGNWTITGHVTAVPVPAALWLLGSGLFALTGLASRKKASVK